MPKIKLSIWVDEEVARRLKHLSAVEQLTLSEYGATLLTHGITQRSDELIMDLVGTRIERALRHEVGAMADRLAILTVQAALEAGTARRLVLNQLAKDVGPEAAQQLSRAANDETRERLRTPSAAVRELLGLKEAP